MPPPNVPDGHVHVWDVEDVSENPDQSTTDEDEAEDECEIEDEPSQGALDVSRPSVDLHALEYEGVVDENLLCPICHTALVSPVITKCDHVFCRDCLNRAHRLNPVCPVDRTPLLSLQRGTRRAPRIIFNQLDSLTVQCPNKSRGCDMVLARSSIQNHYSRHCDKTLVPCQGFFVSSTSIRPRPCTKLIMRKDLDKECLHYEVDCDYCGQTLEMAGLEEHQDKQCLKRKEECELCKITFLRHKQDEHLRECPEAKTTCKFSLYGCTDQMSRKKLEDHVNACPYRGVARMMDSLERIQADVTHLQEKDRLKDRRIKFLENKGYPLPSSHPSEPIGGISLPGGPTTSEAAPYESRDQYFLSLFETMESKIERLASVLREVGGQQSMMLYNETLPIKDQLTEIRSTLGVLGMHVRWLMNFRLQERGRVGNMSGHAGGSLSSSSDNNGDSNLPRRLSDNLRENPARL